MQNGSAKRCFSRELVVSLRFKLLRHLFWLLPIAVSVGCVLPNPHTSERSPAISGRVVDSGTKRPIKGAHVSLRGYTGIHTLTDGDGYFHLNATRNFHLLTICGNCAALELPQGHRYGDELLLWHPDYATRESAFVDPLDYGSMNPKAGVGEIRTFVLHPKPREQRSGE